MALRLDASALTACVRHGAETYPDECCGLLVGRTRDGEREALESRRARNVAAESLRSRYLVDPADFLRADADARARGLDLVGFYHSHPDHASSPSSYDLEHAWEGYSYLVLEVTRDGVLSHRSWTKREGRFVSEPLLVLSARP